MDQQPKPTESGNISFYYTQLSELKHELPPDPYPQMELSKKAKMITLTREYETDIITLFHATGDFNFRSRWQEGVKRVEEIGHFLPRVGMHCRLVHQKGEVITYASSYSFTPERIEFSETDEKKKYSTYYILEKINNHKTRLTLDYYIAENAAGQIIFKLMKERKMEDALRRSMRNLESLVKEIRLN